MRLKLAALTLSLVLASALGAQGLDQVTQRLTIIGMESEVMSNITYKRAQDHEMKLDVITPGPRSEVRPTLFFPDYAPNGLMTTEPERRD